MIGVCVWQRAVRDGMRMTAVAMSLVMAACHGLLDVSDPTLIQDADIANARGANARRINVLLAFDQSVASAVRDVAIFTDERMYDFRSVPVNTTTQLDLRNSEGYETATSGNSDPHLGALDGIVTAAAVAIPAIRAYSPDSVRGEFLAQLYAMRGYAIVQMAEDVCPGFPINDIAPDNLPIYSAPYTMDSALAYGVAQLDSALAYGHDSTQFLDLARVVKGRALLDLGRYAEAATMVTVVPTNFNYATDAEISTGLFQAAGTWNSNPRMAVGEREGGTGLPFVSAQDPRVQTAFKKVRYTNAADSLYDQLKYATNNIPIVVASGIEARLIEAEAQLAASDPAWLATLNLLRTTAITPAMPVIASAPTTVRAQVDLLYRERAFWLYLTGRRLGDARRLIRNYARAPETVFPTGSYPLGGVYGSATAIPFVQANEAKLNPRITSGCTTR